MLPPIVTDVKGFLLRNCNKSGGCRLSVKWQSHFTEGFRVLPLTSFPGGKTRRVQKPSVFIRFAVHAAKAGINIRGCAPLSTPGGGSRSFLFDKLRQLRYNIFKYNTQGKRRSAHHPKGGVAYVEIVIFAHQASARCKYDNYHHKEITALP